jgi:hypothetical protein
MVRSPSPDIRRVLLRFTILWVSGSDAGHEEKKGEAVDEDHESEALTYRRSCIVSEYNLRQPGIRTARVDRILEAGGLISEMLYKRLP